MNITKTSMSYFVHFLYITVEKVSNVICCVLLYCFTVFITCKDVDKSPSDVTSY